MQCREEMFMRIETEATLNQSRRETMLMKEAIFHPLRHEDLNPGPLAPLLEMVKCGDNQ